MKPWEWAVVGLVASASLTALSVLWWRAPLDQWASCGWRCWGGW